MPQGRTQPWVEEARGVLNKLKGNLKVAKCVVWGTVLTYYLSSIGPVLTSLSCLPGVA